MELKPYQTQILTDLARFVGCVQATRHLREGFAEYWATHPTAPVLPRLGEGVEPYKNNVPGVPHVCVKVPTAGGKTYIATNALRVLFDGLGPGLPQVAVWLVPSVTILDQTLRNLRDVAHPYRQRLNTQFGGRVEVFDKAALLQGSGFSAGTVGEQLSVVVLSFDSLRARNKEDRKVYQDNGNLQSFGPLLAGAGGGADEAGAGAGEAGDISLMRVLQALAPVVIVDESHNAESELSVEMLRNLNPRFILDLTATPRRNSNIISFVDALALKQEHMVKLPVIVYNHRERADVIQSALHLRHNLEAQARQEQKNGGPYIRPIVLFQAQPRTADDNATFEKIRQILLDLKVPAAHIRIKTAGINELKGEDLLSAQCPVRYIITVNALREGWDCPFAYVLASLADKSSAVDVEQVLGRVLRQPYVRRHADPRLNMSYVLTASTKFLDTLGRIVAGLNKAGFSARDYKVAEAPAAPAAPPATQGQLAFGATAPAAETTDPLADPLADIDVARLAAAVAATTWAGTAADAAGGTGALPAGASPATAATRSSVAEIEALALTQHLDFEATVAAAAAGQALPLPTELEKQVKTYPMKAAFAAEAAALRLPQFYLKVPGNDLFGTASGEVLLDKDNLLEGFALGKADTNIAFDSVSAELYRVDLDETQREFTPSFVKVDGDAKERLMAFILDPSRKDSRVKNFTKRIIDQIGAMAPIAQREIERYVGRILEDFTEEQFTDLANHEYSYARRIKERIGELAGAYAQQKFWALLDVGRVLARPAYALPPRLAPGEAPAGAITKSLYEREGRINGYEERVINEVANLPGIAFWTRNLEHGQNFCLNGFLHHYPDFILRTAAGKTLLLETKGDHLDAAQKIDLGNRWAAAAGPDYRYFLVYEKREVPGAYTLDKFLALLKQM